MTAPNPQLVVSDGKDWTVTVPDHDMPFLKKIYGYYGRPDLVENVHLPDEGHDFDHRNARLFMILLLKTLS